MLFMFQASEFVIIPKNEGGKKSNDGEEFAGRGAAHVDVAIIVNKLEAFVKEQVRINFSLPPSQTYTHFAKTFDRISVRVFAG